MRVIYVIIIIVALISFIFYMVYLAHHDTIKCQTIVDNQLPYAFHKFRLFFISDIHRRKISLKTLQSINEKIDIVIIGGDLMEKGVSFERVRENIVKLKQWKVPVYFIWGNNDYEAHPEDLYDILRDEGVIQLANSAINIKKDNQVMSIAGLDCCRYSEARIDMAMNEAEGSYIVLVTHDPSSFYDLNPSSQQQINTVLAGHTHGGQIRILGMGMYQKGGLKLYNQTNVLVSEGYGYTRLPLRLETKAECHVLTFKNYEE
ncbi:metallophosphoesterase [Virgibacillus byunsanensis]|uniref:Metallophosphoesterase n=1 Tax=Virgibacillus byunsanensis TaxID=570945 RepID=A0ABW3LN92_9BACI